MISERDLLGAIKECEKSEPTYQMLSKLADLYTVHSHLYGNQIPEQVRSISVIDLDGESEFSHALYGKEIDFVIPILDELMDCLKILQPKIYESVMRKLSDY